ncbi:DUF2238 domain-containing protein [Paenibacillus sp. H1-7]|uniref:DUF2238 domain-containing protein n=1 Tax=Paenibacillus sp. H1-7 TaxID=2282849 RepID=UPI001EF76291|nr:DUF2238 domain-containing protein [Paenibacillus sp. H1-7]ULL16217.1 DUF2238 domain-containing protein [Paenibacillus sp. H1-7]
MNRRSATVSPTSSLMNPYIPFSRNHLLQVLFVSFLVFWAVMAIRPTDRLQWLLENVLVVVSGLLLILTYPKYRFSNLSYLCIFVFLCLHTYAAHHTYQNTPMDMWLKASFHTQRSYFDRVVHFAFGLLLTYPMREMLMRKAGLRGFWSLAVSAAVIFACSALFEILEMIVALVGAQAGQDYMGMQGDPFDTHKDMALGLAGAIVSMGIVAWVRYRNRHLGDKQRNKATA